jgi:hypothetical protein
MELRWNLLPPFFTREPGIGIWISNSKDNLKSSNSDLSFAVDSPYELLFFYYSNTIWIQYIELVFKELILLIFYWIYEIAIRSRIFVSNLPTKIELWNF